MADDTEVHRQLGVIEGKTDTIVKEIARLAISIENDRIEQHKNFAVLRQRVDTIERAQVKQNAITATLAAVGSALFVVLITLADWGSKFFK